MKRIQHQLRRFAHCLLCASLAVCLMTFQSSYAEADAKISAEQKLLSSPPASTPLPEAPPTLVPPPPNLHVKGYVLMDADTGTVLAQQNSNERLQPASLTKLMTLYVVFQALKSGQIHLTDNVHISADAWRTGGSRMFVKEGSDVPLESLIQGIIVASGNDACVAAAQYVGGTEQTFAQMMNQTAERLGMKDTHYTDSTGLPNANHYSTSYDMALLTRALIEDFPEYYHYFSEKWLTYNHIKQPNRNRLLWRNSSVDGLKTGHTDEAGFCLISSAKRNDMRLISVVMGSPTDGARANDSEALLNYGFRFYNTYQLFGANKMITQQRVWLGQHKFASFGLENPLYVTIPIGEYKNLKASLSMQHRLRAPLSKGQAYGQVEVTLSGKTIAEKPLVALQDNQRGNIFSRMMDHISLLFRSV